MPGIQISTAVRTGPSNNTVRETSQAFFVGQAVRGPVDEALLVTSLEDFEMKYGGYTSGSFLHPTVESFFEEGGTRCYIVRCANTTGTATANSLLLDSADDTTITLTANGPGVWGNNLSVKVQDGAIGASGDSVIVTLYDNEQIIMSTGTCTTPAQICGKINTHPVASLMMTATDEELGTLPITFTVRDFGSEAGETEGDDGTTAPGANEYGDGLDLFLDSFGAGVVACPEIPTTGDDTFTTALIAHCNDKSRLGFLHAAKTDTDVADLGDIAEAIQSLDNTEHVALFAPWVSAPTGTVGVNRWIPPTGYAAGARARAHNQIGPHQPGAGIISNAKFINGVYQSYDKTTGDALDEASINAIRVINNIVRIYGARSLSIDTQNFRYINAQDVVNHVVVEANRTLEDVLFTVIDGRNSVFASVEAKLVAVMEPLRTLGALYEAFDVNGRRIDYGYTVKCDSTLNPLAQLIDGTVTARVGMRVSSIGDSIQVDIIKSNLTTSVV
jgi:hypothetical protein